MSIGLWIATILMVLGLYLLLLCIALGATELWQRLRTALGRPTAPPPIPDTTDADRIIHAYDPQLAADLGLIETKALPPAAPARPQTDAAPCSRPPA